MFVSSALVNSLERLKHAFASPSGHNMSVNDRDEILKSLSFDLSPDCISLHDLAGGLVLVSSRAREIFGVGIQNLLVQGHIEIAKPNVF